VPYTANAQTVLYNKDMFEEMGLQVPTTWDELIQVSEDIKQKGGTPFFFGYKDSWTTLVGFNSLIGNTAGELFGDTAAADISFKDNVQEAAEKEYQLMQYANKDPFGQNYDQASSAFAKGESAMYLQGIWAIAPIKNANPDINLGSFALPVKDAAEENLLVSGVDQLFAVSKDSKNQEEVIEFIRFLLEPEQAERFINDQGLLSAVQGVNNSNPILDGIKPYLDGGKLVNTPDAFFPQSFDVKPYLQSYLLDGDLNKFLDDSDKAWKQSAAQ
jgi:raffinose/stachyose/melibiose transport system substrate-binding protein